MEAEWGDDVLETDSPRFASYAALGRGILHERGSAEWCRWVADRLEGKDGPPAAPPGPQDRGRRVSGRPSPEGEAGRPEGGS